MKSVGREVAERIQALRMEFGSTLPDYAVEKDYHVFDAIRIISELPENEFFRPVFCGGTCLSKAYGTLERMSEDVDFKIVPTTAGAALSNSALRKKLSRYRSSVIGALEAGGFGEGSIEKRARDDGRYTMLNIGYESHFSRSASLRPHLLVELNLTGLAMGTEEREVGLLLETLAGLDRTASVSVECVSIAEAYAEKLVSFPRRYAHHRQRSGGVDHGGWDQSLVRHLYDLHQIKLKHAQALPDSRDLQKLVVSVIRKDAADFANQHQAFVEDPRSELILAMERVKSDDTIRAEYEQFVRDMVYAPSSETPSFDEAAGGFFDSLMRALPPRIDLSERHDERLPSTRSDRLVGPSA